MFDDASIPFRKRKEIIAQERQRVGGIWVEKGKGRKIREQEMENDVRANYEGIQSTMQHSYGIYETQ